MTKDRKTEDRLFLMGLEQFDAVATAFNYGQMYGRDVDEGEIPADLEYVCNVSVSESHVTLRVPEDLQELAALVGGTNDDVEEDVYETCHINGKLRGYRITVPKSALFRGHEITAARLLAYKEGRGPGFDDFIRQMEGDEANKLLTLADEAEGIGMTANPPSNRYIE